MSAFLLKEKASAFMGLRLSQSEKKSLEVASLKIDRPASWIVRAALKDFLRKKRLACA